MKICFSKQMREIDQITINDFGIPGIVLMENAGLAVVREIEAMPLQYKSAAVVCGTGNNGGDGFVIARHLHNRGFAVAVILAGEPYKLKGDALVNFSILQKLSVDIMPIDTTEHEKIDACLKGSSIIIDALLGTGFEGVLSEKYRDLIEKINMQAAQVISVDIPSGLNGDSGFFFETCIKATVTVTLQMPKIGLVINDGPEQCGRLVTADISIPQGAVDRAAIDHNLSDEAMIKPLFKIRQNNSHKGTYGKALTVACSSGMTGSGILAARAALRSGCGLSVLAVPKSLQPIIEGYALEIISIGLEDNGSGLHDKNNIQAIVNASRTCQSILIGPGMTSSNETEEIVKETIGQCNCPIVIDADGLNSISNNTAILKNKKYPVIITPHPGEMARIFNCTTKEIQNNRLLYAAKAAREFDVITVLKGFRTVIALPDGRIYINPTGNSGMATAGSGDVLGGIIAGFLAQGFDAESSAICGVYIHGAAGDCSAEKTGEYGLVAGDIVNNISRAIKEITGR